MKRQTTVQADGTDFWMNSHGVLTAATDSVLCMRLADAAHGAMKASAGDSIDRGLALLAELKKQGFGVIYLGEPPPPAAGLTTCARSHPHENMSPECERLTVIARQENAVASGVTAHASKRDGVLCAEGECDIDAGVRLAPGVTDRDGCEFCLGAKGGVPGNENRIGGHVVCDYCTPLVHDVQRNAGVRVDAKPVAWLDSFGEPHRRREDAWDGDSESAEPRPLYEHPPTAGVPEVDRG